MVAVVEEVFDENDKEYEFVANFITELKRASCADEASEVPWLEIVCEF